MKYPIRYAWLLLFILTFAVTHAQNPSGVKPKLFNNFPDKINCSQAELSKVFTATVNQNINLSFSDNFLFSGAVTSNVIKYSNLQSVIIKSPVFADAIFALSKIINSNGSISYVGRIINTKYFDGYELKQIDQNNYQLIKIETDKVIQDCSHH